MAKDNPVQSVDRVLNIVEALAAAPRGLALSELAAAVGLPVSTAHRLLAALAARDYVQNTGGKYRLTLRLFSVGSGVVGGTNLISAALPYLEELAELTGETIHLVARRGSEVVYLYKEESHNTGSVVRIGSFVGQCNPMYCTAVGKAILAFLPPQEAEDIWNGSTVTRFTEHTITRFDALAAELVRIRAEGVAYDREEHEAGVACIAAPVMNYTGLPVAAISVSFPAERISGDKQALFAQKVKACAASVSVLLGGLH